MSHSKQPSSDINSENTASLQPSIKSNSSNSVSNSPSCAHDVGQELFDAVEALLPVLSVRDCDATSVELAFSSTSNDVVITKESSTDKIIKSCLPAIHGVKDLIEKLNEKLKDSELKLHSSEEELAKKNSRLDDVSCKLTNEVHRVHFLEEKLQSVQLSFTKQSEQSDTLVQKLSNITGRLNESERRQEHLTRFYKKLLQIMGVPAEFSMSEMLSLVHSKAMEHKQLSSSYKSLTQDFSDSEVLLTKTHSILDEKDKEIRRLRASVDDEKLALLAKEQQNLSLLREVERGRFNGRVTKQLISLTEQMAIETYKLDCHFKLRLRRHVDLNRSISDLQLQNKDLEQQNDLLLSLVNDNSSKNKGCQLMETFYSLHIYDTLSEFYRFSFAYSENLITALKAKYHTSVEFHSNQNHPQSPNRRDKELIKDLRREVRRLENEISASRDHKSCITQLRSLSDDLDALHQELANKNRVIDALLQKLGETCNLSESHHSLDRVLQMLPSPQHLAQTNRFLKNTLEESINRISVYKETISTLGAEIDRLNNEIRQNQ